MDPLGDEWVDKKKDAETAATISSGLHKSNARLQRQNDKLQGRIDKANAKGNTEKASALGQKQLRNTVAMAINDNTKNALAKMETSKVKFTFNLLNAGDKGQTEIKGDVVVIAAQKSSFGNQVHEIMHGADIGDHKIPILFGRPNLDANGVEKFEMRAYKAQMAADPSSMPSSKLAPMPGNTSEVTGPYVGGIMNDDRTPLYPGVNNKYHKP